MFIAWPQQNKAHPSRVHISWDIVYVATAQTKWLIFCRQHFRAHFCLKQKNSFLGNKPIFTNNWGSSLGEGPVRGNTRSQDELFKKLPDKSSNPIEWKLLQFLFALLFIKWLTKNKLAFMQITTWGRVGGKPLYAEYQINIVNANNRVTCPMNYVLLFSNSYEMSLNTSQQWHRIGYRTTEHHQILCRTEWRLITH